MKQPPQIFISATSGDLRNIRQMVKEALLTINCHPVEQTTFEPDARTVMEMLRAKITDCQALIHICGLRYGAEPDPATLPPGAPRRSYTQIEYDIGRQLQNERGDAKFRVYTFICPDNFPYDAEPDHEDEDKRELQRDHRTRLLEITQLREKPADAESLRARVLAMQEQVFALESQQGELKSAITGMRRVGFKVAVTVLLLLVVICGSIMMLRQGQERIIATQDRQSGLLQEHGELLKQAVAELERLTEEKESLGIKIHDLPGEEVEKELARRMGISAVELRLHVTAGRKSQDALIRARANFIAGNLPEAILAAEEVEKADATAIARVVEATDIKAEASFLKADYDKALNGYQRIAALLDRDAEPVAWAEAQHQAAMCLGELGKIPDAISEMEKVVSFKERVLGPNHPAVAKSLCNLANFVAQSGRFQDSERFCRRALEIDEAQPDKDDWSIARDLNCLAGIVEEQGNYPEAEALLRRAIEIGERILGPTDTNLARGLNNLGNVLKSEGKLTEAEAKLRRALAITEAALGGHHPDVATELANLGNLLRQIGQLDEAETLERRAVKIGEERLGANHPGVAISLVNLAIVLDDKGKRDEAESLLRRAIEIGESTVGKDHPDVAGRLNNLAALLQKQQRLTEAEPLARRAVSIFEKSLGMDHPSLATSLNELATIRRLQGEIAEADQLYRRAIAIGESRLGEGHPDLFVWLLNEATLLRDNGRPAEAEPYYRRVVLSAFGHRKRYGSPMPDEDKMIAKYSELLQRVGRSEPEAAQEIANIRREAGIE